MRRYNFFAVDYVQVRGLSYTQAGLLMGICMLVAMGFTAPFMPYIMPKLGGASRTCLTGVLLYATSRFFIVPIGTIISPKPLFWLTLLLFMCSGVAFAGAEIGAGATIYCSMPPEMRYEANAVFLKYRVFGGLLGPALGGTLYQYGGFATPFSVGGMALLCTAMYFKEDLDGMPTTPQMPRGRSILTDWRVVLVMVQGVLFPGVMFSYILPYLAPLLLKNFSVTPVLYGLISICVFVAFIAGTSLAVRLKELLGVQRTMVAGAVLMLLGYFYAALFGDAHLSGAVLGTLMSSLGAAFPFVLAGPLMIAFATDAGVPDQSAATQVAITQVIVGGLARFIGPLLGGFSYDHAPGLRFVSLQAALISGIVVFGIAFLLLPYELQLPSAQPKPTVLI